MVHSTRQDYWVEYDPDTKKITDCSRLLRKPEGEFLFRVVESVLQSGNPFKVLNAISEKPETGGIQELAKRIGGKYSTVHDAVDKLEKMHLVEVKRTAHEKKGEKVTINPMVYIYPAQSTLAKTFGEWVERRKLFLGEVSMPGIKDYDEICKRVFAEIEESPKTASAIATKIGMPLSVVEYLLTKEIDHNEVRLVEHYVLTDEGRVNLETWKKKKR